MKCPGCKEEFEACGECRAQRNHQQCVNDEMCHECHMKLKIGKNKDSLFNYGLCAAAEYIEILEKHIDNLENPTFLSGYIGPHTSDIVQAKGKWCAAKAIAELGA